MELQDIDYQLPGLKIPVGESTKISSHIKGLLNTFLVGSQDDVLEYKIQKETQ